MTVSIRHDDDQPEIQIDDYPRCDEVYVTGWDSYGNRLSTLIIHKIVLQEVIDTLTKVVV